MSEIDDFSSNLLEEAKRFFEKARASTDNEASIAFLHASLLLGYASLEAFVNSIGSELLTAQGLNIIDQAIMSEKKIELKNGEFVLASKTKFWRLHEKIEFYCRKFSGHSVDKGSQWWQQLKTGINIRNAIAHPRKDLVISENDVKQALAGIIDTMNELCAAVYNKPYPSTHLGLQSSLRF